MQNKEWKQDLLQNKNERNEMQFQSYLKELTKKVMVTLVATVNLSQFLSKWILLSNCPQGLVIGFLDDMVNFYSFFKKSSSLVISSF